jgi:hypothetical protein
MPRRHVGILSRWSDSDRQAPKSVVDFIDFYGPDIGLAGNIERFVETSVMSRAQPKSSPTDQHARRIGSAIAKGRRPALTPNLELYLQSCPHEVFAALEGVACSRACAARKIAG